MLLKQTDLDLGEGFYMEKDLCSFIFYVVLVKTRSKL